MELTKDDLTGGYTDFAKAAGSVVDFHMQNNMRDISVNVINQSIDSNNSEE